MQDLILKIRQNLDKSRWKDSYFTTPTSKSDGYRYFNSKHKVTKGRNFKDYIEEILSIENSVSPMGLHSLISNNTCLNPLVNPILLQPLRVDLSNFHICYFDIIFSESDFLPKTNKPMLKEGLDAYRYHNVILDEKILNKNNIPQGFLAFILNRTKPHYSNKGVSTWAFQNIVDAYLEYAKNSYTESIINDRYYEENMFILTSADSKHYERIGCIDLNKPVIHLNNSIEYDISVGCFSEYTSNSFKKSFKERVNRFATLNHVFMSMYAEYSSTHVVHYLFKNRGNTFYSFFEEFVKIYTPVTVVSDDDSKGRLKYSPKSVEEAYKPENLDYYFTLK